MSFITFDLLKKLTKSWLTNLSPEVEYWYRTVNSDIPIFGYIMIPVTIVDIYQSCTPMIGFIVIETLEKSLMVMGADALKKYHANIQFGEMTVCKFLDYPTVFQTNDGKS